MWSDALCTQSHETQPPLPSYQPRKSPFACQPCAGKELTEAIPEFLEEVDTADRPTHSISRRRPVSQICHSHHFIC